MKKLMMGLGGASVLAMLGLGGVFAWGASARDAKLEQVFSPHDHAVTVPTPLSEAELESLRAERTAAREAAGEPTTDETGAPIDVLAGVDLDALAMERAIERGKHLVNSRYFCVECHGKDFSGGTMVDAPPMGSWLGPNLTAGEGGVVSDYTPRDWDRIVRHGVRKDGTGAIMPSEDFVGMSDEELADIIAYVRSFPAVDNTVPERTFGPVSTMLIATGNLKLPAETFAARTEHPIAPPEAAATAEFGGHLAQTCTGCHRAGLNGGPILGGDPAWPPSTNLTGAEGGIAAAYAFEDFEKVMRTGVRKDGSTVAAPMSLIPPYASTMTDTEMRALWAYIQSLPATPTGT